MAIVYNQSMITDGLCGCLESNLCDGTSTQSIVDKGSGDTITAYNYTRSTSSNGLGVFVSNAISDGSGSSSVVIPRTQNLETGSITFIVWFNVNNIPVDVGSNNNWRGLLCTANSGTAGSPLTMVMEQSNVINFSTSHTDQYRRYLNGSFAPVTWDSTGWQMVSYTYNSSTGQAACYKNNSLVLSGPMTSDGSGSTPTTSGLNLSYSNYQSSGFRVYGGTNTVANPSGNGICPGLLGNIYIYNRALTSTEIIYNFNQLRGRYGI
jgi:hypothetical protein